MKSRRLTVILLMASALDACGPNTLGESARSDFHLDKAVAQSESKATGQHMAIEHNFILSLPSEAVEATEARDLAECAKTKCTILSSRLRREQDGEVEAWLTVRIAPDGVDPFISALSSAPSTVVDHSVSAEDKSVALIDIEKRLESKKALRDRLQAMLRESTKAPLADLVALEKELSTVQNEIETAAGEQLYLQTITETVKVDIAYRGIVPAPGGLDFGPLTLAVHDIGDTIARSTAHLVTFLAAILPWTPLIALALWGLRRLFRRWRRPA